MNEVVTGISGDIGKDFWALFCRQGIHHFINWGDNIGDCLSIDVLSC